MPCYIRMKTIYLRGLLWLYLLGLGCMALSLEPGFLDFDNLPDTNFSCVGKVIGGYYADLETNCQMFHVCTIGQLDEPMDIRFLCLNGTVFDQETRVCERIDEVDCSRSEQFYSLNLELYGNTQPSIPEENAETEPPIIIKSTTTTTTTTKRPKYYTTPAPAASNSPKVISTHHFPIAHQPDIRFNPSEINISLNPGAPPNIRPNNQSPSSTQKNYGLLLEKTSPVTPVDINYGFTYRPVEKEYDTEVPQPNYQYQTNYRPQTYSTTTRRIPYNSHSGPTTFRNNYLSSLRHYNYGTEKPQRLQLPIPLLPTLPPLTFSSPAPFTLNRHIDAKRFTNEHQPPPPRIIISASASVSDASGRRLNYSLGTIGVAPLIEESLKSYDEDDHVAVLNHFYQDVPKLKNRREKRQVKPSEVIKNEQEAVDVLKFLFSWYKDQEKSTTEVQNNDSFVYSPLFQRTSKFNIVGDVLSVTEKEEEATTVSLLSQRQEVDYVDDNYEPSMYLGNEAAKNGTDSENVTENYHYLPKEYVEAATNAEEVEVVTEPITTTTSTTTSRSRGRSRGRARHKETTTENSKEEIIFVIKKPPPKTVDHQFPKEELVLSSSEDYVQHFSEEVAQEETTITPEVAAEEESTTIAITPSESFENADEEETTTAKLQEETINTTATTPSQSKDVEVESNEIRNNTEQSQSKSIVDDINKELASIFSEENSKIHLEHSSVKEEEELETTTEEYSLESSSETTTILEEKTEPTTTTTTTRPSRSRGRSRSRSRFNPHESTTSPIANTTTEHEEQAFTKLEATEKTIVPDEFTASTSTETESTKSETSPEQRTRNRGRGRYSSRYQSSSESVVDTTQTLPFTTTSTAEIVPSVIESDIPQNDELASTTEFVESAEETTHEKLVESKNVLEEDLISTTIKFEEEKVETLETTTISHVETTLPQLNLTPVEITTQETTTTTKPTRRRRIRPGRTRSTENPRPSSRHRFSTEHFTPKPSRRKPVIEEEIIEAISGQVTTTEEVSTTDAPLYKSANPTLAEHTREFLPTTPLSRAHKVRMGPYGFIFNCFGRKINQFYSDPRDCRLFHYCTSGYTRNQLLDMKFVCDLGTYFDDEKLICTKDKPARCL